MNFTLSRGVWGNMGVNDSTHIRAMQNNDKGYFFTKWVVFCIFTCDFDAKVRIILYFCKQL